MRSRLANSSAPIVEDDRNEEVDLRELLGLLWDRRWLIAIVTALFLIGGVAYALLATPVYQANAMVQVEKKVPTIPGLSDLTEMATDSAPEAVTEIALMTSRMVVGKAVDKLNLDITVTPHRLPLIGNFIARRYEPAQPGDVADPMFGLDNYDWGGSELDIYQLDVPKDLIGQELTLIAGGNDTFRLYDEDGNPLLQGATGGPVKGHGVTIQVRTLHANRGMAFSVVHQATLQTVNRVRGVLSASEQGKDSGIITVSYRDPDPARASAILGEVVQQYVLQNVERASAEAANKLAFVKQQLPGIRKDLEKAENALSAYQTKAHTANLDLQTQGLLDQIVAIETSLSQLKLQEAQVEKKYTPQHPAYQAMMQQIGDLQGKKQALQAKVSALPETQQKLLGLSRDVEVSTQLYTTMLAQAQQLDVARAGTVGNARVVDKAAVDVSDPVAPRQALVIIACTVLGGFLAIGWVLVQHMLNRGIEDPAQIERLGLPVYASIPLSPRQRQLEERVRRRRRRRPGDRLHVLALEDPTDLAVESVRSLRTSLHFAMLEAGDNRILMISGASPDAGKSFVSTNLAVVVAQAGQRVLLLDGDLRKGGLHHIMGHREHGEGLSDLLVNQATPASAIQHTPLDGLDFLARGQVPPNPSELLMHVNFTRLLKTLSADYDLIIIDTPPILAVTDAAIIGTHAGTSLMVARFGMNQGRELALARQRFEQNRVELKGAIFNAVERRTAGYYSYGYYDYQPARA